MRKAFQIFASLSSFLTFTLIFGLTINSTPRVMAEPRGEIRVVESWRPDVNVLGHNVLQYLFEYALDKNELVPSLAISRRWIDPTTLELELRQGVRFHNGEPFDADAVNFNFEYQRKHNPGRGVQVYLQNLEKIQIVDSHTIRMILRVPDSLFLDKLILGPVSGWVIGAPEYMEEVGCGKFLRRPIGTGPYVVKGEIKDRREVADGKPYAELEANEDYWRKGYPRIRKISFIQSSPEEALRDLIEGRLDLVTYLIPKDTLRVAESSHAKVVKGRDDVAWTTGFLNLMSLHTIPLRDMRVRKALNYAVNKEELLRYAYKGNAYEMRGLLTEKCGVDLADTVAYDWNILKARKLLKEAGFAEGFQMKLCCTEQDHLLAQFLQRFYRLLNIDVEISAVDWKWVVEHLAYNNTRTGYSWENEDWWIILHSQPGCVPELMGGILEWRFHSGAPFQTTPDWLMPPLDRMYQEIRRTRDRNKRFQIYKEANEYVADQALMVVTMGPLGLYGVNKELNFVPQISQYLYLDYSSVADKHWSIGEK